MRITIANNSNVVSDLVKACLLVFGSTLMASCMANDFNASDGSYFNSQKEADNRLAAFDEENPSCQLWTNWQKMCSRTGPNGETFCVTDPDKSVMPSEPFCAGYRYAHPYYEHSSSQEKSHLRFCEVSEVESLTDAQGNHSLGRKICTQYKPSRPFNGRSLKARSHPYCDAWVDKDNGILSCSKWASDLPCEPYGGHDRITMKSGLIDTLRKSAIDYTPVYGVMCGPLKGDK